MAKVILRQEAIDDLNEIWQYTFNEWSEVQADKYYATIKFHCLQIGKNPKLGREFPEIAEKLFGLNSGKHIIFYQILEENDVEIIIILHERMDLINKI
jgi:toxin ParE1/3/4